MGTTISAIKHAYRDYLWRKLAEQNLSPKTLLSHLTDDGEGGLYFADLDYTSPLKSVWPAGEHVIRLLALVGAYGEERQKCPENACVIIGLLRHWLSHNYVCPNWWHNDIGVPMRLGQIALLTEEILPDELKPPLKIRIKRGTYLDIPQIEAGFRDNWKDAPPCGAWTGANFLWGMTTSFTYALLTEDKEILKNVKREIAYQFLRPASEGINPDHSFYQHGTRWYSGGYGRSFLVCVTPMICAFLSASVPFSKKALDLFLSQFLDGARHFTHRGYYDFHAVGRELSRKDALHVGEIKTAVKALTLVPNLPRKEEMLAFLSEMEGKKAPKMHTVFFPYISHLSHKYKGCYFGITGMNQGEMGAEHCNGEGVLCYHMTYGSKTCFMGTGKEYSNIDPLFDYAYVPGTTTFDETDDELLARDPKWTGKVCWDRRLACATTKRGGILTQRVEHDGISYISTFVVENGTLVALGTNIENTTGKPLHTTIDQAFAQNTDIQSPTLAHSGKFSYHILSGKGHFAVTHRTGNTQRNNRESLPKAREGDVFLAAIEDVTDQYAYAITLRNTPNSAEILQNLPSFQAVRMPSGKIYVANYTLQTLAFNGKTVKCFPMGCYIF